MMYEDRKKIIEEGINKLVERVRKGAVGGYLLITEKTTGKYVQCSILSENVENIFIEVPEGQLSEGEIDGVINVLSRYDPERATNFQASVGINAAFDAIESIFREGLNFPEDYDVEVELLI